MASGTKSQPTAPPWLGRPAQLPSLTVGSTAKVLSVPSRYCRMVFAAASATSTRSRSFSTAYGLESASWPSGLFAYSYPVTSARTCLAPRYLTPSSLPKVAVSTPGTSTGGAGTVVTYMSSRFPDTPLEPVALEPLRAARDGSPVTTRAEPGELCSAGTGTQLTEPVIPTQVSGDSAPSGSATQLSPPRPASPTSRPCVGVRASWRGLFSPLATMTGAASVSACWCPVATCLADPDFAAIPNGSSVTDPVAWPGPAVATPPNGTSRPTVVTAAAATSLRTVTSSRSI